MARKYVTGPKCSHRNDRPSLCEFRCLWHTYRSLPLPEQFKWEWIAFSVFSCVVVVSFVLLCIVWGAFS